MEEAAHAVPERKQRTRKDLETRKDLQMLRPRNPLLLTRFQPLKLPTSKNSSPAENQAFSKGVNGTHFVFKPHHFLVDCMQYNLLNPNAQYKNFAKSSLRVNNSTVMF